MIVRPLLEITRPQTQQFCQDFQLPVWEDSTNQDLKYARNRIRQELIPYLRQNFNPQVESALAQTAELLQAEVEYLEKAAQQLREEAMVWGIGYEEEDKGKDLLQFISPSPHLPISPLSSSLPLRLNRRVLQKAPLALQRRVMRQVLQEVLADAPGFEHIEKLTALITAPNRSQTDPFPGGAIAQVQGDWICLKIVRS